MFAAGGNIGNGKTTSYKVVLPFYIYAGLSFFVGAVLLVVHAAAFRGHYFQAPVLAITHIMALGWGTMIILGASHQLVPVLIEGELYSNKLAYVSFCLAAIGIPLLVCGFYTSDLGRMALTGGALVVLAVACYFVNLICSISNSRHWNIHAKFIIAATLWLLVTTILGFILLCNFTHAFLPHDSLHYLALHAHLGIVGWFLLTVMGVGARLIPLFLISKYNNPRLLNVIFYLVNIALVTFVSLFLTGSLLALALPATLICCSVLLFGYYCFRAYKERIRKHVDEQMKISLLSVGMISLPLVVLVVTACAVMFSSGRQTSLVNAYGFLIFFGWITAIILGMTFKTLPFIVWYKNYHHLSGKGATPNPKDLFSEKLFKWMVLSYIVGLILFTGGIVSINTVILQAGALLLLLAATLYGANVLKLILLKPGNNGNSNQ